PVRTYECAQRITGITASDQLVFFQTEDGLLHVWNWANVKEQPKVLDRKAQGKAEAVKVACSAFTPDGLRLLWGDNRGNVHLFDSPAGKEMEVWAADPAGQPVKAVSFTLNGLVVAESADGMTHVLGKTR